MGACCGTKHNSRKQSLKSSKEPLFLTFIENKDPLKSSYTILKKIGEGATGHVKSISCQNTSINRAVKSIKLSNDKAVQKSQKEIAILKKLDYPTILRPIESYSDNAYLHIVSELYTGQSLYEILNSGTGFSESQACLYLYYIASGIKYLHHTGIAHRDIKPENIILESEDQGALLKIIDFGSADYISKEGFNEKCGTVLYMSPQVLDGKYSEKCDVWSAGIIFYIMIAGAHPFYSDNEQDMLDKIRHLPVQFKPPIWSNVSPDVIDLISKMLAKQEENRLSISDVLRHKCLAPKLNSEKTGISEVYSSISACELKNELHRAIFNFSIIKLLDSSRLGKIFMAIDIDGDGKISYHDFGTKGAGRDEEISKIFQMFGESKITYTQFIICCQNWKEVFDGDMCVALFKILDKDNDELISWEDLSCYSTNLNRLESDFKNAVKENGSNELMSFDQFLTVIK